MGDDPARPNNLNKGNQRLPEATQICIFRAFEPSPGPPTGQPYPASGQDRARPTQHTGPPERRSAARTEVRAGLAKRALPPNALPPPQDSFPKTLPFLYLFFTETLFTETRPKLDRFFSATRGGQRRGLQLRLPKATNSYRNSNFAPEPPSSRPWFRKGTTRPKGTVQPKRSEGDGECQRTRGRPAGSVREAGGPPGQPFSHYCIMD